MSYGLVYFCALEFVSLINWNGKIVMSVDFFLDAWDGLRRRVLWMIFMHYMIVHVEFSSLSTERWCKNMDYVAIETPWSYFNQVQTER